MGDTMGVSAKKLKPRACAGCLGMDKRLISQYGKPDDQHQDISHCAYPLSNT